MSENPQTTLPPWAQAAASIAIGFHLLMVIGGVLVAPSGPWPGPDGGDMATPPHFAQLLMFGPNFEPSGTPGAFEFSPMGYLKGMKLTHNYHFFSNRPPEFGTKLEARLRDAEGNVFETVVFPEENANFIARHRQQKLVDGLTADIPVEAPPGESIPAPNQPVPMVRIWEPGEGRTATIRQVEEHLIPRDRPVFGPSDWSMILARSYARRLCREYNAASVEIVRRVKPTIPPDILFLDAMPRTAAFDESAASFGVFNAPQD